MKNTGKGLKGNEKEEVRKDRKSGTGMNGSPKKGGHGGKFTWEGDSAHLLPETAGFENGALDANDPNFEDLEDIAAV